LEQGRGWDEPIRDLVLRVHHYTQTLRDPEAWFGEHLAALEHPQPERWEHWLREGVNQWREGWLPILQSQLVENLHAHRCALCLGNLPAAATRKQIAAALPRVLDLDQDWPKKKRGVFRKPIEKLFDDAA